MDNYVTGSTIKQLRETRHLTQAELAEQIGVSDKAISKWETAKGLPDISLLQPLAAALGVSVIELMNEEHIINSNVSSNMMRSKFYVCPICGNVIHSTGDAVISCCGVTLPALEAEARTRRIILLLQSTWTDENSTAKIDWRCCYFLPKCRRVWYDKSILNRGESSCPPLSQKTTPSPSAEWSPLMQITTCS